MKNNETKRDTFVRVAAARTNKIIDMVRLLGNCSASGSYEYTAEDVEKIFSSIESEINAAKLRYKKSAKVAREKFTL